MSSGKARNILINSLVFKMAKELEWDNCFRCDEPILSSDDLSYDHREPWRGVSPDLYWDLENFALSHKRCNTVDRPGGMLAGTAWCAGHKTTHPREDFSSSDKRNGVNRVCREWQSNQAVRDDLRHVPIPCPECESPMRKLCQACGYVMPMKDYMALRRKEGATY